LKALDPTLPLAWLTPDDVVNKIALGQGSMMGKPRLPSLQTSLQSHASFNTHTQPEHRVCKVSQDCVSL